MVYVHSLRVDTSLDIDSSPITSMAMATPLDTDAGSELFSSYEADLRLVQADLGQKLDQIPELSGEPRKALIRQAEHTLDEANELVGYRIDLLHPLRVLTCMVVSARSDATGETEHPVVESQ